MCNGTVKIDRHISLYFRYFRILESAFRLILTRDNLRTQQLCADVAMTVLDAAQYSIALHSSDKGTRFFYPRVSVFLLIFAYVLFTLFHSFTDVENGNCEHRESYKGAEGTADGLQPVNSLVFAVLEVALCLLVRQVGFKSFHLLNFLFRLRRRWNSGRFLAS